MKAVGVDLPRRDCAHRDLLGTGEDAVKESLAIGRADLLGVVQQRQRADAVVAQARVIEQYAGNDERPC